jgi:hypothetical protein
VLKTCGSYCAKIEGLSFVCTASVLREKIPIDRNCSICQEIRQYARACLSIYLWLRLRNH